MPEKAKRKRGAPKGNQDAKKHVFYSKVLDEAERLDFELAAGVEGIDDEIALLRVEIKSILELEHNPEDVRLIIQATNALERLIRTRYKITKEQRKGLKEAIGNIIRDIAVPLGIAASKKSRKADSSTKVLVWSA